MRFNLEITTPLPLRSVPKTEAVNASSGIRACSDSTPVLVSDQMLEDYSAGYAQGHAEADAAHNAITTPLGPASAPTEPSVYRPPPIDGAPRPPQSWPAVSTPPLRPRWSRKTILIPAALFAIALVATAIIIVATGHRGAAPTASPSKTPRGPSSYGLQLVLPFTDLNGLGSVAVDTAGNVYVTNASDNRVRKLGAGSHSQTVLPFTDLHHPAGVAVDRAGNVYVTDEINARVVKLAPGSNAQTVLPFSDLHDPTGVAVDSSGNVYVSDNRVVTLAPGSNTQTVLPFTGLDHPEGLAVDGAHNVYLADTRNNRVLKLPAGSGTQTLLQFSGLNQPRAVAVDNAGNVYANTFDADFDSYYVLKLAAG